MCQVLSISVKLLSVISMCQSPTGPVAYPELTVHRAPRAPAADAVTSDWPRFLGPGNDATSPETRLLSKFPKDGPSIVWEMATGEGYASPAIASDRLVFMHRLKDDEVIDCLDPLTGRRYWRKQFEAKYTDRYGFGAGPRCSPVIDGGFVYCYGVTGRLTCQTLSDGEVVWQTNTSEKFRVPQEFFGVGSSPLVVGDRLIVQVGAPGGPTVVAFDKKTGKVEWQAGDKWGASYASPVPAKIQGVDVVLVFAGGDSRPPTGGLLVIDPRDGRVRGRYPFRSDKYESVNASSPVCVDGRVFISSSYDTGGVLLSFDTWFTAKPEWKSDALGAHFMTPIAVDGYLYGIDGMGGADMSIVCVDLKTGRRKWDWAPELTETLQINGESREVTSSIGRGSLMRVDGKFLCLTEGGHLLCLDLTPKGHKLISRAWLFAARETWALPPLSHGLLYVNQNGRDSVHGTNARLICYDLRGE
ncbi:MAG: PQQ-like beta-propeller repeat protein [Phycisphaerales bacterium]|nr:PQQ-like beta-propeller repeat protein [Phycisphaerales bacterium]MCB9864856.1 PQQ-like beta-propeller repeat protein [Phycisphaerales bacterium]